MTCFVDALTGQGVQLVSTLEVERRSLMRGSSKILVALVAVVILAATFAHAEDELGLPTDKTAGTAYNLVRFDGVVYRIFTEIPCELHFSRIDDEHHLLTVKPIVDKVTVTPFCDVQIQWGLFSPLILGLEIGGTNSWILGTETGYAEK
jgi:hypothetical protein